MPELPPLSLEASQAMVSAYVRVGQVAVLWSTLERQIDQTIWAVAGLNTEVGACITSHIQSLTYKINALTAIVALRGHSDLVVKLNKLRSEAEPLGKLRNEVIHTPISVDKHSGQVKRDLISTEKRKLTFSRLDPDAERESKIAMDITLLMDRMFSPTLLEIRDRMCGSPSTPPAAL